MPSTATPCTTRALIGQLCPQVSGRGCKPSQILIDAQALLLKLMEHLIEALLCILHGRVGSQMQQMNTRGPLLASIHQES